MPSWIEPKSMTSPAHKISALEQSEGVGAQADNIKKGRNIR
jgi:hypothetical protein